MLQDNQSSPRIPIVSLETLLVAHTKLFRYVFSFFGVIFQTSARQSSTSRTSPPPATAHPDRPSFIAHVSTTHADPPATTSHSYPPSSTHRPNRYDGSHARALFRHYVPRFCRSQPNTIEPSELQQKSNQHVTSVHVPVENPTPWARFIFFIFCVRRTQETDGDNDGGL